MSVSDTSTRRLRLGKVCVSASKAGSETSRMKNIASLVRVCWGFSKKLSGSPCSTIWPHPIPHTPTSEHGDELLPAGGRANKDNRRLAIGWAGRLRSAIDPRRPKRCPMNLVWR